MADTSVQREAEDWIRRNWMPLQFNQGFEKKSLSLSSGGVFNFDAVSDDEMIVANISTSSAMTSGRKRGAGKFKKIIADIYYLLLLPDEKRKLLIFTEPDMAELCNSEKERGRIPKNIEIIPAPLPLDLRTKLQDSRKDASDETSPQKMKEHQE